MPTGYTAPIYDGEKDFTFEKFVCPVCGRAQSVGDFEKHGIDSNLAYQNCLGRHVLSGRRAKKNVIIQFTGYFASQRLW